jgi:hypothetical protein
MLIVIIFTFLFAFWLYFFYFLFVTAAVAGDVLHQFVHIEPKFGIQTEAALTNSLGKVAKIVLNQPVNDGSAVVIIGVNECTVFCALHTKVYGKVGPRLGPTFFPRKHTYVEVAVVYILAQGERDGVVFAPRLQVESFHFFILLFFFVFFKTMITVIGAVRGLTAQRTEFRHNYTSLTAYRVNLEMLFIHSQSFSASVLSA